MGLTELTELTKSPILIALPVVGAAARTQK